MAQVFDQSRYQIRFEWGDAGLARLAETDVVVLVDVLTYASATADAVAAGESVSFAAAPAIIRDLVHTAGDAVVMLGSLRNAAAVAREVLAEQQRRAGRTSVAVIAVGDEDAGGARFAVEDQLGAGAIINALGELGIDHTSPEAAAACESFRGLGRAVRHLITASGSGQQLLEAGERDAALATAQLDAVDAVPVLRGEAFVAA